MRRSRKQLNELVDTTNNNLSKSNIDMLIKVRRYDGGYTLYANSGIETMCSGSIAECDKFLRGINRVLNARPISIPPTLLITDSYKISHTQPVENVLDGDMHHSHDENDFTLPYRGK